MIMNVSRDKQPDAVRKITSGKKEPSPRSSMILKSRDSVYDIPDSTRLAQNLETLHDMTECYKKTYTREELSPTNIFNFNDIIWRILQGRRKIQRLHGVQGSSDNF